MRMWTDSCGSCENVNQLSGSTKSGKLVDYLSDYQLLKGSAYCH